MKLLIGAMLTLFSAFSSEETTSNVEYPVLARQARISGTVRFHLDDKGGLLLVSGHPRLVQAAEDQIQIRKDRLVGQGVQEVDVVFEIKAAKLERTWEVYPKPLMVRMLPWVQNKFERRLIRERILRTMKEPVLLLDPGNWGKVIQFKIIAENDPWIVCCSGKGCGCSYFASDDDTVDIYEEVPKRTNRELKEP